MNADVPNNAPGDAGSATSLPSRTMKRVVATAIGGEALAADADAIEELVDERRSVERAVRPVLDQRAVAMARADHTARARRRLQHLDPRAALLSRNAVTSPEIPAPSTSTSTSVVMRRCPITWHWHATPVCRRPRRKFLGARNRRGELAMLESNPHASFGEELPPIAHGRGIFAGLEGGAAGHFQRLGVRGILRERAHHELARLASERSALCHAEGIGEFAPYRRIGRDLRARGDRAFVRERSVGEAVGLEIQRASSTQPRPSRGFRAR